MKMIDDDDVIFYFYTDEDGNFIDIEWNPKYIVTDQNIPPACRNCSKHPSNGGDGICFCINGISSITC